MLQTRRTIETSVHMYVCTGSQYTIPLYVYSGREQSVFRNVVENGWPLLLLPSGNMFMGYVKFNGLSNEMQRGSVRPHLVTLRANFEKVAQNGIKSKWLKYTV